MLLAQTRQFVAPLRVDFSEEVAPVTKTTHAASILDEWKSKKAGTEHLIKLLHAYKDLGDSKDEPYLKYHNPKSFEDLSKPVPNFRALSLKAGELPKFFDSVLAARADDALAKKAEWWAKRKQEAESALGAQSAKPISPLPVPEWKLGKSISLSSVQQVTDAYLASLIPARKLKLPVVPDAVKKSLESFAAQLGQPGTASEASDAVQNVLAQHAVVQDASGKTVEGFQYVTKAMAARAVAARRAEVHERYLKAWAKKLLVAPEVAAVALKDVDAQLASKFENVAPKYSDLLGAVTSGSKSLGERLAESPVTNSFFLKREKEQLKADVPATEVETEAVALAKSLEDPAAAFQKLLGPELTPLGSGSQPLSVQVKAITEHKYTPDRYLYKEGQKLAARYAQEEAALKEQLKAVHGEGVDVAHYQAHPPSPAQQLQDRLKEVQVVTQRIEAEKKATDSPYLQYVLSKRLEVLKDPSNIAFAEVLYPELTAETLAAELAELDEAEAKIDDAEEEELWLLTLTQQFKHIAKHFGVDLPHSVLAYMDPVLIKKIDYETTNGLDDWDQTLDDLASDYAKEQWGTESLSHHFLPLLRYRRQKARKAGGSFQAEVSTGRVST